MSKWQCLVVLLTTLAIPGSFELVQGLQVTGICFSCVNLGWLVLYVVWFLVALWVIASVTQQDRARWEEELNQVSSKLNANSNQIREEHQRAMQGIQDSERDLREWAHNIVCVIRDELGIDLPSPTVSLRLSASAGAATLSFNVTAISPTGRRARLLRWVRSQARNARRWASKILVDWQED